jgi:hypothetical protein
MLRARLVRGTARGFLILVAKQRLVPASGRHMIIMMLRMVETAAAAGVLVGRRTGTRMTGEGVSSRGADAHG